MVTEIDARRLADTIDADEDFALIDTRPKDSYEAWHVPSAENIPYEPDEGLSDEQVDDVRSVADDRAIVVICGKGLTSTQLGFELDERGFEDVSVVTGGMEEWSAVYEVTPIETNDENLVVRQIQRRAKGCLGYVVGSRHSETGVVIDATRHGDQFKVAAQEMGLTIEAVIDTHVHADHLSGGPTLAEELDVPYRLGEPAQERDVEHAFEPIADGDVLEFGDVEIEALHTPGHTSDMMNYLVDGALLLTGDTLFVDSVGRTELQFGEDDAARGAEMLFESLHDIILERPDETQILPGHASVTNDGRYESGSPGEPIVSRLGDLRRELDFLQLDEESFVDRMMENAPEKPPNYEQVIAINTGRDTVEDENEATELELGPNNCAA